MRESEDGFPGVGRENVDHLQLCCQGQSLENSELVGRHLPLKGYLRCVDSRPNTYRLSLEPRQGGVEVRVALVNSKLDRVVLSWRRRTGGRLSGIADDKAEGHSWVLSAGVAGYWSSAGNAFLGHLVTVQFLDPREPDRV